MIVLLEDGRIPEPEQHHLRVRRARDGEVLELRDGHGLVGQGRLREAARGWEVEIVSRALAAPPLPLVLAVGAGDRDRFAWVVEKAVELGVTSVVPLETERTRSVAARVRPAQVERLRRQALEAVKQSGNPWAADIEEAVALDAFLARSAAGERWVADAGGAPPPAVLGSAACTVIVGPEGGLTERERDATLAAGYRATSLGPHILRLETAALAAAAAVQAARLRGGHG